MLTNYQAMINPSVADTAADPEKKYETDVKKLNAIYQTCLVRPQSYYTNAALNRDQRYNYWPGKSWDARKWRPQLGDSEIFPWPGASDLPIPMIDGYINEDTALAVLSVFQGNLTVSGHSVKDAGWATRATNVCKWMLNDQMTERFRETALAANYHFERGKAVILTLWDRQTQMTYETLTLDMLNKMSDEAGAALQQDTAHKQQLPSGAIGMVGPDNEPIPQLTEDQVIQLQELAAVPTMLQDPQYTDRLIELLQDYADRLVRENFKETLGEYEDQLLEDFELSKETARRITEDLRDTGRAKIPIPQVIRNRPIFAAAAVDEDFFFPSDAVDLENARALFWREWITEEQVKERKISHGWDPAWCDYILKHGKGSVGPNAVPAGAASGSYTGSAQAHGKTLLETQDLYGVLHCFEKRCNEDGVPGIYYTVIHPALTSLEGHFTDGKGKEGKREVPKELKQDYAMTTLLDYAHGEYPVVFFRREFLSRRLDDSRGYGEAIYPYQMGLKKQFDSQIDRTDLATIPPLHHPKGRPPSKWGPGVKVPGSKADYAFAEFPQHDPGSSEVIMILEKLVDRYMGRPVEGADPVLAQVMRQYQTMVWLDGWRLAITQMFQLLQQFLPDEFYYRVVGSDQGQSLHATREDIQGKFTVTIKFDTQRLDLKAMQEKIQAVTGLVSSLDINGITDHNKLLALCLTWVDPDIAELILKPADAATQQELDDEDNVFARMWAGVGTDVRPGQAHQLRLQRLQTNLAGKDPQTGQPKNPAAMQRYQQDPNYKALIDNRMQQLQFQITQRQNAVIGRLGAPSEQNAAPPGMGMGMGQMGPMGQMEGAGQ